MKKSKRYNSYSDYVKNSFSQRIQKISIDAGFTCPNRDGRRGRGGCTYCNNDTFNPFYCSPEKSVSQQLKEGIAFFETKYPTQEYFAYFQAYSNTYADVKTLEKLYAEALSNPKVKGLIIGTRPDCVDKDIFQLLQDIAKDYYLVLELGIESTIDKTLKRINRGHNFKETIKAFEQAEKYNLQTGGHMILGLPGESRDDMLLHAKNIAKLPINFLKLHQLQIVKKTQMAMDYLQNKEHYQLFGMQEYVEFIPKFISYLPENIVLERFTSESPSDMLIAPKWGRLKNYQIVHLIENELVKQDLWQGKSYKVESL